MPYRVSWRRSPSEPKQYLGSPVNDAWPWSTDPDDAHHFASRRAAKETLRRIDQRPQPAAPVSACSFEKVPDDPQP